ncbi:MAG: helix-turn-helix domain-containing protein [Pirellulaceae bacterium]|nr:helix-turn-helix domain-containing protein [Pirellulaceae bacterium]
MQDPYDARALIVDAVFGRRRPDAPDAENDRERRQRQSFLQRLGREPIHLNGVEYRILAFLASRPYHAFPRRRIVEAVSTRDEPVTDTTLDQHIASLRDKLGFFRDYVQSVPYIGYRFKA